MDSYDDDLNSVESYDVFADQWTSLPNMINGHCDHSLVVVKNKLFVIGNENKSFEVFDNVCKKFVALKSTYTLSLNKAISIGDKIVIFQHSSTSVICYDVDKDEWFEESCEVTKYYEDFSLTKLPQY